MPWYRPTLPRIIVRAVSDTQARLGSASARLRTSVENVLARVVAGLSHELHGHLAFLARQVIWDTADGEYLVRWGRIFGLVKKAAQPASGDIIVTGTPGTLIPAGTQWARADGWTYEIDAPVTLTISPEYIPATATEGGSAGNAYIGDPVTLTAPIAGINSGASPDMTGGVDEETDVAFLRRFLDRLRRPPSGGGPGDYERWTLEYEPTGASRAWEFGKVPKVGEVTIYCVRDTSTTTENLTAPELAELLAYVEGEAPAHMEDKITLLGPTLTTFPVAVTISPNTSALADAVKDAIVEAVREHASPGGTMRVGWLHAAISRVPGLDYHTSLTPAADSTAAAGVLYVTDEADVTVS